MFSIMSFDSTISKLKRTPDQGALSSHFKKDLTKG